MCLCVCMSMWVGVLVSVPELMGISVQICKSPQPGI